MIDHAIGRQADDILARIVERDLQRLGRSQLCKTGIEGGDQAVDRGRGESEQPQPLRSEMPLHDAEFAIIAEALEPIEQGSADFYPYSSRYDAFLAGKATLTAQEMHGLDLFEDEAKGNCASCHLSRPANDGEPPQFTDFGLIGVSVPRNPAIPANADPAYFDLGLCGPLRTDFKGRAEYCGLFRTPSLRNVALRKSFFHNGYFHTLRDAVAFYATRDTDPGHWYPRNADGTVDKFDDLPKAYWGNLNTDPPFNGKKPGDKPALTDAEIDDIVVFLETLTDADQVADGQAVK